MYLYLYENEWSKEDEDADLWHQPLKWAALLIFPPAWFLFYNKHSQTHGASLIWDEFTYFPIFSLEENVTSSHAVFKRIFSRPSQPITQSCLKKNRTQQHDFTSNVLWYFLLISSSSFAKKTTRRTPEMMASTVPISWAPVESNIVIQEHQVNQVNQVNQVYKLSSSHKHH